MDLSVQDTVRVAMQNMCLALYIYHCQTQWLQCLPFPVTLTNLCGLLTPRARESHTAAINSLNRCAQFPRTQSPWQLPWRLNFVEWRLIFFFSKITAVFGILNEYAYQFTCTEWVAPRNSEVHR